MNESTNVGIICKARFAGTQISLCGKMGNDGLEELSGCVAIDKSLPEIIGGLAQEYTDARDKLKEFINGADIRLDKLVVAYRNMKPKILQVGFLMDVGNVDCQFSLVKELGNDGGFITGINFRSEKPIPPKINFLSGLIGDITIKNFGIFYADKSYDKVPNLSGNEFQNGAQLPAIVTYNNSSINQILSIEKGFSFIADISIGGVGLFPKNENSGDVGNGKSETSTPSEKSKSNETSSSGFTKWFKVEKNIGPVSIKRVGISYKAQRVGVKFDAGMKLSCLTFSLDGLGISYPINKISKDPKVIWENLEFNLTGASIAFERGPLTIGGCLVKVNRDDQPLQLNGGLIIRAATFSISAIGSYTTKHGKPSFFMFAVLSKGLGGPPCFFVTGLALGMGVNRSLKLPTINEVQHFPLVQAATDPNFVDPKKILETMGEKLNDYITPSQGEMWIAAGVKFTSFSQIESFALLTVSFGTQFQIALLGLSRIQVPKAPARPIISAEIALKCVFTPESGLFSFEARLTENSYILHPAFKLRGGLAFYSWFSGPYKGDFVVSMGGYHPKFKVPAHYPKPDLVEFQCKIDSVTIQGHCYFALCPSAIMAGGGLSIVYEYGGIRAWFIASADFLMQWKPLYYNIAIGISIGVALNLKTFLGRIHLSFELGASVNLFGPPLGGKARVSLYIISFTVEFGQPLCIPPSMVWDSIDSERSFVKSFLPNSVVSVSVTDGLLQEMEGIISEDGKKKDEDKKPIVRIVNPHRLVLSCLTQIPVTQVCFNNHDLSVTDTNACTLSKNATKDWRKVLNIRPMQKSGLNSRLTVKFSPTDDFSKNALNYLEQYIEICPLTTNVPFALWGDVTLKQDQLPEEHMVDNTLVGIEIKTKSGPRPWETPPIVLEALAYDTYPKKCSWTAVIDSPKLEGYGDVTLSTSLKNETVRLRRSAIINKLRETHTELITPDQVNLDTLLLNKASFLLQAMPVMAVVGQYPPRKFQEC